MTPQSAGQMEKGRKKALVFNGRQTPKTGSSTSAMRPTPSNETGKGEGLMPSKTSAFDTVTLPEAEKYVLFYIKHRGLVNRMSTRTLYLL